MFGSGLACQLILKYLEAEECLLRNAGILEIHLRFSYSANPEILPNTNNVNGSSWEAPVLMSNTPSTCGTDTETVDVAAPSICGVGCGELLHMRFATMRIVAVSCARGYPPVNER